MMTNKTEFFLTAQGSRIRLHYYKTSLIIIVLLSLFLQSPIVLSQAPGKTEKAIGIGYISNTIAGVNPRDAHAELEFITRKIIKKNFSGQGAKNIVFKSTESAVRAFANGEIALLSMLSINYLEARDKIEIEPLVIGSISGKAQESYLLLVKKNTGIDRLAQLKNKKIIIPKGGGTIIAMMWIDTLLMGKGFSESRDYFRSIKKVDKPSMAVLSVFFGQSDACVVNRHTFETMVDLNLQVGRQLKILFESPGLLGAMTCIGSRTDPAFKKVVENQFYEIDKKNEYRQILILFQIQTILKYRPEYLVNTENLYNDYQRLKKDREKNDLNESTK